MNTTNNEAPQAGDIQIRVAASKFYRKAMVENHDHVLQHDAEMVKRRKFAQWKSRVDQAPSPVRDKIRAKRYAESLKFSKADDSRGGARSLSLSERQEARRPGRLSMEESGSPKNLHSSGGSRSNSNSKTGGGAGGVRSTSAGSSSRSASQQQKRRSTTSAPRSQPSNTPPHGAVNKSTSMATDASDPCDADSPLREFNAFGTVSDGALSLDSNAKRTHQQQHHNDSGTIKLSNAATEEEEFFSEGDDDDDDGDRSPPPCEKSQDQPALREASPLLLPTSNLTPKHSGGLGSAAASSIYTSADERDDAELLASQQAEREDNTTEVLLVVGLHEDPENSPKAIKIKVGEENDPFASTIFTASPVVEELRGRRQTREEKIRLIHQSRKERHDERRRRSRDEAASTRKGSRRLHRDFGEGSTNSLRPGFTTPPPQDPLRRSPGGSGRNSPAHPRSITAPPSFNRLAIPIPNSQQQQQTTQQQQQQQQGSPSSPGTPRSARTRRSSTTARDFPTLGTAQVEDLHCQFGTIVRNAIIDVRKRAKMCGRRGENVMEDIISAQSFALEGTMSVTSSEPHVSAQASRKSFPPPPPESTSQFGSTVVSPQHRAASMSGHPLLFLGAQSNNLLSATGGGHHPLMDQFALTSCASFRTHHAFEADTLAEQSRKKRKNHDPMDLMMATWPTEYRALNLGGGSDEQPGIDVDGDATEARHPHDNDPAKRSSGAMKKRRSGSRSRSRSPSGSSRAKSPSLHVPGRVSGASAVVQNLHLPPSRVRHHEAFETDEVQSGPLPPSRSRSPQPAPLVVFTAVHDGSSQPRAQSESSSQQPRVSLEPANRQQQPSSSATTSASPRHRVKASSSPQQIPGYLQGTAASSKRRECTKERLNFVKKWGSAK